MASVKPQSSKRTQTLRSFITTRLILIPVALFSQLLSAQGVVWGAKDSDEAVRGTSAAEVNRGPGRYTIGSRAKYSAFSKLGPGNLLDHFVYVAGGCDQDDCVTDFKISAYEVTKEQFNKYLVETGSRSSIQLNSMNRHKPVVGVSVSEVIDFARWSSKSSGKKYRLPTVAEWRQILSSMDTDSVDCTQSNLTSVDGEDSCSSELMSVGSLQPTESGIYDLFGNAAEMVCNESLSVCESRGSTAEYVLVGGSWEDSLNSFNKGSAFVVDQGSVPSAGFRLVQEL